MTHADSAHDAFCRGQIRRRAEQIADETEAAILAAMLVRDRGVKLAEVAAEVSAKELAQTILAERGIDLPVT